MRLGVSWVFPRPRNLRPERKDPDDFKIVNAIVSAVAKRHGLEDTTLLERAHSLFGWPGGKWFMVNKLLEMIPEHKTFVEPYCGSAALFFSKIPSDEAVLNDLNSYLIRNYQIIKDLTDKEIDQIGDQSWEHDPKLYAKLYRSTPHNVVERIYRLIYLARTSFGSVAATGYPEFAHDFAMRHRRISPERIKQTLKFYRAKLHDVTLLAKDAMEVIREYDSPTTFFYLDPPYEKISQGFGMGKIDIAALLKLLHTIQGKFLLSLGLLERKLYKSELGGFNIELIHTFRNQGMDVINKRLDRTEILVSNYDTKLRESTHEEQREQAEKIFGNPYYVRQKGDSLSDFVVQWHLRGLWVPEERKDLFKSFRNAKHDSNTKLFHKLWVDSGAEYLTGSLNKLQSEMEQADEARKDVTAIELSNLAKDHPELSDLNLDLVVNRFNAHDDLRMKVPDEDRLIGWTVVSGKRVGLQFLTTGKLFFPLRDKFLENQQGDKTPAARKSSQPLPWLYLVSESKPEFWSEPGAVGATVETGGLFIFKARGKIGFSVVKDDFSEYLLIFDKPYQHLSGRWTVQKLPGRKEYEKIPEGEFWWMLNKPHISPAPYIMYHSRVKEEEKAKQEKLTQIYWNQDILLVARKHLPDILSAFTGEQIEAKLAEFQIGTWKAR